MNRIPIPAWVLIPMVFVSGCAEGPETLLTNKPNFVVLFADDLGYGDLSSFGNPTLMTPNLDRMAREGVKLTSFYVAAPSCTPSRAALLTGRYPMRSGLYRVLFPEDPAGIPESEVTLGEALQSEGYRTMAIGKWHLGHKEKKFLPTSNGFDQYYGLLYSNDMIPPYVQTKTPLELYRNEEPIEEPVDQSTLTERYATEAVHFIRQSREDPFFIYLAYTMPHVPLFASEEFSGKSRRGLYGDVVETIDWSVGYILEALEQEGLDDNTLVMFTSDNGPWLSKKTHGGTAGLLREGKGTTYEGGMRVPFVARWPGSIPEGLVSAEVATSMDIYPTLLALAGASIPANRTLDGKNFLPVLQGTGVSPHEAFFYYRGPVLEAIRQGRWKLRIPAHRTEWRNYRDRAMEKSRDEGRTFAVAGLPWGNGSPELFDLETDPSERFNRIEAEPETAAQLKEKMIRFAEELVPGPAFALTSQGRPKE